MKLQKAVSRLGKYTGIRVEGSHEVWKIVRSDNHVDVVALLERDCVTFNIQVFHADELADLITLLLLIRVNKFFDILQTLKITDL